MSALRQESTLYWDGEIEAAALTDAGLRVCLRQARNRLALLRFTSFSAERARVWAAVDRRCIAQLEAEAGRRASPREGAEAEGRAS